MTQSLARDPAPHAGLEPRRMLDRYEILAEIARGGMGTVYLARLGGAGGFERLFAIKLMHEHLAEEPQFVTMLLDEARTAAHIHHPNAVGIIDARESPVGYYLVMNYVDGFAFSSILEHDGFDARTRIRLATRLIADAAHGLHAAHTAKSPKGERLSIVHRDVSPQNILVGVDGVGRIVDFGIALAASRITSSRPGMLKGKPSYMAPEQARAERCDARTDVFALGIVLWESLTRTPLFQADLELATLVKVMECVVEPPTKHVPELPEALVAVTMKALAKEPADRFATAREMGVALERAAEAADLIADAHEVEETLARLFADEIRMRQESVTRRLSGSTGPERPLDRAGLATVPRLIPRGGLDSRVSDSIATGGAPARSGVRESRSPGEASAWHESQPSVDVPAAHAPTQSAILAPSPPASAPRRAAWVVAAAVIAIAAIVGTIAALTTGTPPVAETATETEAETEAEAEVPRPDPVAPQVVAPQAEVVAPPAEVVAPQAVIEPVAPAPTTVPHGRRRRDPTTPAVPSPAGPSPAGPSTPQVEVNPYLTH